jgi:hypothetical protein
VTLARRVSSSAWAARLAGLLGQMIAYSIERVAGALRPPARRQQALARQQARVLRQRMANDAMERM